MKRKIIKNSIVLCAVVLMLGSMNLITMASTTADDGGKIDVVTEEGTKSLTEEEINNLAEKVFPTKELQALMKDVEGKESKAALTREGGFYPTRQGMILVTKDWYKGLIPTGHAAIVVNSGLVLESVAPGVIFGPNNWHAVKETCYGLDVAKTGDKLELMAAFYANEFFGKPYNLNYWNVDTRSAFYCSQLVWASYMDLFKIDLNTAIFGKAIHPMELVASPETILVYKK